MSNVDEKSESMGLAAAATTGATTGGGAGADTGPPNMSSSMSWSDFCGVVVVLFTAGIVGCVIAFDVAVGELKLSANKSID